MSDKANMDIRVQHEVSELALSVATLVEDFKKLRRPLVESHRKVPEATNQLDIISEQTEAATHQMLDTVEQITRRDEEVIKGIEEMRKIALSGAVDGIGALADAITEKVNTNLNDAFLIMDSLQFQDITAQQMDHAASLLESVETRLRQVLSTIGVQVGEEELSSPQPSRKIRAFDPHANFIDQKTNQEDIDSLFHQKQK